MRIIRQSMSKMLEHQTDLRWYVKSNLTEYGKQSF